MVTRCIVDTSTLSEVMRGYNASVHQHAVDYLAEHDRFTFSLITRYEVLRGLRARGAARQVADFEQQCASSDILALSDEVIVQASEIYADLYQRGALISDADILIAATALVHELPLVTENSRHFERIPDLSVQSWR